MTSRSTRMMVALAAMLWAIALQGPAAAQQAAARRVDDSGTVVGALIVPMRWRHLVPGRGTSNDVDGEFDVALRLNLAPWMNRNVRLYLVLEPPGIPGLAMTARWRAGGRLLPGSVQSGGRALVYQGRVTEPLMQEKLQFMLTVDGNRLSTSQAVQFHIEAEAV